MLIGNFDSAAELMATAWQDVLASCHFPASHWHKLLSPNPLERDNEEIKLRTLVEVIFPNDTAIVRLAGAVLLEQDQHWQLEGRHMFSQDFMAAIPPMAEPLPEAREKAPIKV